MSLGNKINDISTLQEFIKFDESNDNIQDLSLKTEDENRGK